MLGNVKELSRKIPVTEECDVLVCGGGIAGVSAALAAARNGARTILIEREYLLGGLATLGLVTIYLPLCDGKGHQVSFGIAEELLKLSVKDGIFENFPTAWFDENSTVEQRAKRRFEVQYNPFVMATRLEQLLLDEGVKIIYGTLAANVTVKGKRIKTVIVENKSGRSAISVNNAVVDATGDADICKLSGAKCEQFKEGNVLAAWYYSNENNKHQLNMVGFADIPDEYKTEEQKNNNAERFVGLDANEISRMVSIAHTNALNNVLEKRKENPNIVPVTFPTIPQIRMTRRIDGAAVIDDKNIHGYVPTSIGMISDWRKAGPVYELPFEILYGKEIKNLITAGRNISVTDSMWDITRVIPVCAVTGEAAGTAAAVSNNFSELDVGFLQQILTKNGVKLHCEQIF